ncbi:Uncharacterised protein [uncultured archaeon]|nr:Uncharacterised protein [uncultured archaeon]
MHRRLEPTPEEHRRRFLKCLCNSSMDEARKSNKLCDILAEMPIDLQMQIQEKYGRRFSTLARRTISRIERSDHSDFGGKMESAVAERLKEILDGDIPVPNKIKDSRDLLDSTKMGSRIESLTPQVRPYLSEGGKRLFDYLLKSNGNKR